jgi:hypothetical protein
MTTRGRYRALTWFRDHEADPAAMLMRKRPSKRMCRLMTRGPGDARCGEPILFGTLAADRRGRESARGKGAQKGARRCWK